MKTRTQPRIAILLAPALALVSCGPQTELPAVSVANPGPACENVAVANAEALAPSGTVTSVNVTRDRHEGRDGGSTTRGNTAWVRVPDCPQGFLVVDMAPSCQVRTIFTNQGCSIPGVRSF
jgi:hypothetical protein